MSTQTNKLSQHESSNCMLLKHVPQTSISPMHALIECPPTTSASPGMLLSNLPPKPLEGGGVADMQAVHGSGAGRTQEL